MCQCIDSPHQCSVPSISFICLVSYQVSMDEHQNQTKKRNISGWPLMVYAPYSCMMAVISLISTSYTSKMNWQLTAQWMAWNRTTDRQNNSFHWVPIPQRVGKSRMEKSRDESLLHQKTARLCVAVLVSWEILTLIPSSHMQTEQSHWLNPQSHFIATWPCHICNTIGCLYVSSKSSHNGSQ